MGVKKEVLELIGDFYESHANCDYEALKYVVTKLESIIDVLSEPPLLEYFSGLYSGRAAYDIFAEAKKYPSESIMRELFQNAFDSYYNVNDVKLVVNFKGDGVISIAYNEIGFTLEQFLYFLSVGRSENDLQREGRFGIGAKSVFMNSKHFVMRSNSFEFSVRNNDGKLTIESLNCHNPPFKGTEITITVDKSHYEKIEENFLNLTTQRGIYMNIMDLCFAFNRKKILNIYESYAETIERTFNIAITKNGKFETVYRIENYQNPAVGRNTIRFSKDGRGVIDFIAYEYDGVVILIPFAMSKSRRKGIMDIISARYNLFSTYELTGLLSVEDESILNTKLSAFFISVPNTCITSQRTGLSPKDEIAVRNVLKEALTSFINENSPYFLLQAEERIMEFDYSVFSPVSFLFDFIKKYMFDGGGGLNLEDVFFDSLSFKFPNEAETVPFSKIAEIGFYHKTSGVPYEEHLTGESRKVYINQEFLRMESELYDLPEKTICIAYEWEKEDEKGREFLYKFYRRDKTYLFADTLGLELCDRFKFLTETKWGESDTQNLTDFNEFDDYEDFDEGDYDEDTETAKTEEDSDTFESFLEDENEEELIEDEKEELIGEYDEDEDNDDIEKPVDEKSDEEKSDEEIIQYETVENLVALESIPEEKSESDEILSEKPKEKEAKISKVNRILPDQVDLQFKPKTELTKEEFKELRALVQKIAPYSENPNYKYYYLKDLNFKYFGYGGYCPLCGYESLTLNVFELYDFSVKTEYSTNFKFSLLMCANDAASAESWIVENLTIGDMQPLEWCEFIQNIGKIPPSLLEVQLFYRERIAYGAPALFENDTPDSILSTSVRIKKFFLTPLLAANWLESNI